MVRVSRLRYVVAVDFGTTFTGISHVNATKKTLEDIQVVKNWPGPSKEFSEVLKTPSKIAYRSENQGAANLKDDAEEIIWGYDVEPGMVSYSWMKLLLDGASLLTEFDDQSLDGLSDSQGKGMLRLPDGKTATEVCTDFLSGVYKYTMQELKRTWGEALVDITPIDYWVTVPATWSDRAKNATQTAARNAGFASRTNDRMFLITEPEAAAIAALSGLIGEGVENQISAGDGILILDCGGGTVDINTYRVQSTTPNLEFEELVVGQGGKIGSTFIDRQFHEWLGSKFGWEFYKLDFKKKGPGSRLMKEFEAIKRDFGGSRNSQKEFRLPLVLKYAQHSAYYDDDENMVILTREDLESFFKPSVQKIKQLLKEQVTKANMEMGNGASISMIVLVGGFGDSQYLYDALKTWCDDYGDLRLICPINPQSAVSRGAALRGLGDIKPSRRRCRRHYGFAMSREFVEYVDPENLRFFNSWYQRDYCSGFMQWKINQGDLVDEKTQIEYDVASTWYVDDSKVVTHTLYACSEATTPTYLDSTIVEPVCKLMYDLTGIDMSRFETKYIDGRRAYRVRYTWVIGMGDQQGVLTVRTVCNGYEIGKAEVDFNKVDV